MSERLTAQAINMPLGDVCLDDIKQVLSPDVTRFLPQSLHNIDSSEKVNNWLEAQLAQSQVVGIYHKEDNKLIGLLIIYVENTTVHLGYLFNKAYWGGGLAKEMLGSFIDFSKNNTDWSALIGGVHIDNHASSHLLRRFHFTQQKTPSSDMLSYKLILK